MLTGARVSQSERYVAFDTARFGPLSCGACSSQGLLWVGLAEFCCSEDKGPAFQGAGFYVLQGGFQRVGVVMGCISEQYRIRGYVHTWVLFTT